VRPTQRTAGRQIKCGTRNCRARRELGEARQESPVEQVTGLGRRHLEKRGRSGTTPAARDCPTPARATTTGPPAGCHQSCSSALTAAARRPSSTPNSDHPVGLPVAGSQMSRSARMTSRMVGRLPCEVDLPAGVTAIAGCSRWP